MDSLSNERRDQEQVSVLDALGDGITGIAWPVSLCMAITIFLVRVLNPQGSSSSSTVFIAQAAYQEGSNPQATPAQNFGGALLNVIIFVAVIAAMTFVLFFLFYYGCYRVIYTYMGFAMMSVFFLMTSLLLILLLQVGGVHVDAISFCYIMWNFSILGTLSTLFMPAPLLLKQGYMVWVGVIIAYIFTWIPDWTSWVLLVAMALYDIAAVLIPGGPLKMLVELAVERNRELPALIYESRPAGGYRGAGNWDRQRERMDQDQSQDQQEAPTQVPTPQQRTQQPPTSQPVAEGTVEAGPVSEGGGG